MVAAGQEMAPIDRLEMVRVNESECQRLRMALSSADFVPGNAFDRSPIWQSGQRVRQREAFDSAVVPLEPENRVFQASDVLAQLPIGQRQLARPFPHLCKKQVQVSEHVT
jgi:hypothetical protein